MHISIDKVEFKGHMYGCAKLNAIVATKKLAVIDIILLYA